MTDADRAIAAAFVAARRSGTALPAFPGAMPATLAAGYAIQNAALALADAPVGGWKVGRINPPQGGIDRLVGPILADRIVVDDGPLPPAMPVVAGGFAAAEAEFLLRIGTAPDPARRDWSLADVRALVDAVHVGIEVAGSPFAGINAHGPAVTIADFGNNTGLVVGPPIPDWHDVALTDRPVALAVKGVEEGRATVATMLDGPFGAVCFLLAQLAARGHALAPGQWVSTGAVTGIHSVRPGDEVAAAFGDRFRVACTIVAR